eukprot:COSAG01_NODE_41502_length_450_cov_8.603989_1_plen_111_part_10
MCNSPPLAVAAAGWLALSLVCADCRKQQHWSETIVTGVVGFGGVFKAVTRSTSGSNVYWIQYRYKQTTAVLHTKYCTVPVLGGGGARTCANISVSNADGTSTVLLHTVLVL